MICFPNHDLIFFHQAVLVSPHVFFCCRPEKKKKLKNEKVYSVTVSFQLSLVTGRIIWRFNVVGFANRRWVWENGRGSFLPGTVLFHMFGRPIELIRTHTLNGVCKAGGWTAVSCYVYIYTYTVHMCAFSHYYDFIKGEHKPWCMYSVHVHVCSLQ